MPCDLIYKCDVCAVYDVCVCNAYDMIDVCVMPMIDMCDVYAWCVWLCDDACVW